MNIKRQMPKLMSVLLSFTMAFSGVLPAYAMEEAAIEDAIDGAGNNGSDSTTEEENLEEIEVTYKQSSSYFVTIPKTIALDTEKKAVYSVKVTGDISADQCVYVAPIDGIPSTEDADFYMQDQASDNKKANVVATVTQSKFYWNSEEVANGYEATDNSVSAPDLTSGTWKGIFQMTIRLESHVIHVHDYKEEITKEPTCTEAGEKTYTCDCGDSYTEEIPAKGHNYKEEITKEPTCTEEGEKTYTCECGDSYTEKMPAKGHHFEDGTCTDCGEKDPDYHEHSYDEGVVTKEPTCTEKGEKTFTCSECGHSYTEEIPMTEHIYISNVIWENTNNGSYKFVQNGNKWISNNKSVNSSTATSTWTITLDKDIDYSFKYKVSSEDGYDKLTITLDSTTIADAISGAGEEITYTNTLTAGTHILTASYIKDSSTNRNDDCGYIILEDTANNMVITKEPTCTEKGEKTFTCSRCGHIYTEEIPAIGHNYENNICTNCGETDPNHIHDYKPYKVNVSPTNVKFRNSSYLSSDATAWHLTQSTEEYDEYACANIHNGYNRKGDLTLTCDLILPEGYEGTLDYPYYYNVNSRQNQTYKYCTALYINNSLLYKFTSYSDSTGAGFSNGNHTIPLSAGANTFTAQFVTYNNYSATGYFNKDKSSATVRLYKPVIYDGSDYHICEACGRKEEHHFLDGVCVECGWREEDHTHHYVDGVCDKCGKSETQYTLKIDYPDFLNEVESVTSNTQYIQDGDILALPEKTDDAFDLSGYSVARAVKDVLFCSSNINNNDAINVWNSGRTTLTADKSILEEFGLSYTEDTTSSWKGISEETDYSWEQTAVSDTITIEKPSVYVFTVSEREKCDNIYDAGFQVGGSLTLQDITNDKSYNLKSLAGSVERTYDYDNVKIRCIQKIVNSTSSTGKYDRTYKNTYMIYLDPGQYKLSASGYAGNGKSMGASSIYYMYLSSPLRSTSTQAAPVINNVKHAAFGGTLYELIPIENGQAFDYSTMYTNETSKDIYLISNWTAKTTE